MFQSAGILTVSEALKHEANTDIDSKEIYKLLIVDKRADGLTTAHAPDVALFF